MVAAAGASPHGPPAPSCSPASRLTRRQRAGDALGRVRRPRLPTPCRGRRAVLETAKATSVASRGTGSAPMALVALPPPPAVPWTIAHVGRGRASPRTLTVAGDVAQNVTFCWRYESAEGTVVVRAGL